MIGDSKRTAVYRMYDADDVLLYIGISENFWKRWTEHASGQPWWDEVERQTVNWYPSREIAAAREVEAIKAEGPKYNTLHAVARGPVIEDEPVAPAPPQSVKVEIIAPGWTGCRFGIVHSYGHAVTGQKRYCVEPDDGKRHCYGYIFDESEIDLPGSPVAATEQLPFCGVSDCSFCSRIQ